MKYTPGTVKRRANGKWQAFLKYKDENDNWKQKAKTFNVNSERAAKSMLQEWHAEMEAEAEQEAIAVSGGANPQETVADYVARYIEGRATNVQSSSLKGYKGLLHRLIEPHIGNIPLDDLTPDDVDKWLSELLKDFKPVTAKKAFVLLKSAMTQAVERDRLAKNPTRTVTPPKVAASKPNALTERDLQTVLAVLSDVRLSPALLGVKIAIFTGLRQEEICGLKWKHVDIKACYLEVAEVIGNGESGYYVKPPKNEKSARSVYYPADLAQSLSERKATMEQDCLAAGIPFTNELYVLGGVDGSYMQPRYLWKKWHQLSEALDLVGTQGKQVTFHDLRHSYATIAIHNGIDVKTVSESMGHSNAAMTLNVYASVNDDAQRRAAETMGDALAGMAERGKHGASIIDVTGTEG